MLVKMFNPLFVILHLYCKVSSELIVAQVNCNFLDFEDIQFNSIYIRYLKYNKASTSLNIK